MSEHRKRRATRRVAEVTVRWSGLAMAVGFALAGMGVEVAVSMLVALAQVLAWRSRLPWRWEVATSGVALLAAVSSFLRLYERITWWDLPMHAALTGLLAVLALQVLRLRALTTTHVLLAGAVLASVWEGMELAGHVLVDPTVYVAPVDTAGDVLAGIAGSAVAGVLRARGEAGTSPARTHRSRPPR